MPAKNFNYVDDRGALADIREENPNLSAEEKAYLQEEEAKIKEAHDAVSRMAVEHSVEMPSGGVAAVDDVAAMRESGQEIFEDGNRRG